MKLDGGTMPGFFICSGATGYELVNRYPEKYVQGSLYFDGYTFKRSTLSKFMEDKVLEKRDSNSVVLLEGFFAQQKESLREI
jgi:hypothetical protein